MRERERERETNVYFISKTTNHLYINSRRAAFTTIFDKIMIDRNIN